MKKLITISLVVIIALSLFATSCKKIDYAPIGENISLEQNLLGKWKLDSVIQFDKIAVDKGFPGFVQRLNITPLFAYNTLGVEFKDGGTGKAGTYVFTNPGNAPTFAAPSGNWSLFEDRGAFRLTLADNKRADSLDFAKAFRVSENKLALRFNRAFFATGTQSQKVFTYYDFNFSRN